MYLIKKKILRHFQIILTLIHFLICPNINAQNDNTSDSLSWNFDEQQNESSSIVKYVADFFTPQLIRDTKKIRRYVMDERFDILRKIHGDIRAVDAIYLKALKIAEYDIARALFLSLMAVLEHKDVNIEVAIIKSIKLPLTFENDSTFYLRIKHLPRIIYKDSPMNEAGDRDKLQHFFASAYITYVSEAPQLTKNLGDFIEWGEAKFVVGGSNDIRDKRANKQGEKFGHDLLIVNTLLPSDYLTFQIEERK